MYIAYRDALGGVIEEIDEHGISFSMDGKAYFNDKEIDVLDINSIQDNLE